MFFGNIYGLDLGTYEIKVYDKKSDYVWKEKNAVAIKNEKEIFSVGDSAYDMYERAPFNVEIVFPMKEGVISRFYDMQYLLQNLLKKERRFASGSRYVIAVPTDVTEVEKKAFFDLVVHSTARAKEVRIVERGIADAVGCGLDVLNSPGIFIANLGGETSELSVLSSGGMVLNKILKIGGSTFDQAISSNVRYHTDFLIGKTTSETLRKHFGIRDSKCKPTLRVSGRNLIAGVPEQREIEAELVRDAMKEHLEECIREMKNMIERTPPEVLRSIKRDGIYICGGLANLKGLSAYVENIIGLNVHIAPQPEICAVNGLKKIIQTKELRRLTYSMLDDNYRWMK